jgi:hypothetical protein
LEELIQPDHDTLTPKAYGNLSFSSLLEWTPKFSLAYFKTWIEEFADSLNKGFLWKKWNPGIHSMVPWGFDVIQIFETCAKLLSCLRVKSNSKTLSLICELKSEVNVTKIPNTAKT